MKAVSMFIQVFALGACLAAQAFSGGEFQAAGVRRAIQTIAASNFAVQQVLPAEAGVIDDGVALAG